MAFLMTQIRSWFDPSGVRARIDAAVAEASLECAEFIRDKAFEYAPYDETKPPGEMHLRDTIQVISEAGTHVHHVIATAPWAEPQEFGFIHWRSGKFVKPRFYMRRAVDEAAALFPQIIGAAAVRQGFHHGRVMGITIGG